MNQELPESLTPLNIKAYLYNAMGACGCSEIAAMAEELTAILKWTDVLEERAPYESLYPRRGTFYIVAGILDRLGLSEHGVAIRCPWLTPDGKRLLAALEACTPESVDTATGIAYDGNTYD